MRDGSNNLEIVAASASKQTLSIVLPCKDEEEALVPVLDLALEVKSTLLVETDLDDVEIILVDDASGDMSPYFAEQFASDIKIIRLEQSLGYGGALKRGFAEAKGNFIAFYDVDYTYDPYALIDLYRKMRRSELDMICGDRLHNIDNMPASRCLGNFFFRTVIRKLFGQEVEDSCTGQRIFRAKYVPAITKLLPDQLDFSLGLTLLFLHFRLPFTEVPVQYHRRLGQSKLRVINDGSRFFLTIMRYWVQFRTREREFRKMLPQVGP